MERCLRSSIAVFDVLFRWFPCHRMPSRSIVLGSWHVPVCSRCFGIILGLPVGIAIASLGFLHIRWYALILTVPLFIDGGTQQMGMRVSNNLLRLMTGWLFGVGMGLFVILWILRDIAVIRGWI
ncbi:MAG: DUF2085 domain-containing protein [Candidatus Omnitrophota bacterium]